MPGSTTTTSPPLTYWVSAGIVAVVLILLAAVPLVFLTQNSAIQNEIHEVGVPATTLASEIQTALSHEMSGVVGFQASGESKYTKLYDEQRAFIMDKLSHLDRLGPNLGPAVELRIKELRGAAKRWHESVEAQRLVTVQLPPGKFRERLFASDFIYETAHEAAAKLNQAVEIWRGEKRLGIGRLERLGVILDLAVLAPLVLLSLFFIGKIIARLQRTTSYMTQRVKEEEALREVAHSLTGALGLDDVLGRISEAAALAGEADGVFIKSIDAAKTEITVVSARGVGVPAVGTRAPYDGSFARQAVRSGGPSIIADAGSDGQCTALAIPLVSDGEPLGALVLLRKQQIFTNSEFPRLQILGDMAALAMRRAITLEELRKRQTQEHFLTEAARILASSLDYEVTLKAVVRLAVPQIADWCVVVVGENGNLRVVETAHVNPRKAEIVRQMYAKYPPRADESSGSFRVFRTGQSELHNEVTEDFLRATSQDAEHLEILRQLDLRSLMFVPLSAGSKVLGALIFVSEEARRYDATDLAFAEDVAYHAALAVQNSRLYEASQSALQARDEVLRVVSHDLRNPVNNINITASLLMASSFPEEKRIGMAQIIKRASERMNRLIEDLIAVARVRAGQKISIHIQPESPLAIVRESYEASKIEAQNKSVRLICETPAAAPLVRADRDRVLQVLYNLIDNALKFTPAGGSVTVRCEAIDHQVRFTVADTGRGIEEGDLERIFDLFWQAKPTAHLGAGFGLAIAKSIVQQHGGKIWAQSRPGKGSTFFFTLLEAETGEQPVEAEKLA